MPDTPEVQSVVTAAEQAAAAGDFVAAEQLLRQAVRLQEADVGHVNPELANTLNNLGVACEMTEQPAEAEICYRKAYAIASATLEPDHPFVVTSRKNLSDFCEARGKPFDGPALPVPMLKKAAATALTPPAVPVVPTPHTVAAPPAPRREPAQSRKQSLSFIAALSVIGLVVAILVLLSWMGSSEPADPSSPAPSAALPAAVPDSVAPTTGAPAEPVGAVPPPTPARSTIPAGRPSPPVQANRTGATGSPQIASAVLCRSFTTSGSPDWRCDPAGRSVDGGSLVYYTRIKSPNTTTVQHRWYRGSELYQSVDLRVRANQVNGYRTYSRYTMKPGDEGAWRVELRNADGALLREERFTVR